MEKRDFSSTLEFTNDGKLSLFFIGAGTAFAKNTFQTNLLIVKGQTHVLVDCGTMCGYAFENVYNAKMLSVTNLLLTHAHADHIGGVEELAFSSRYINKAKINLIITDKFKKKLWNESLKGGFHYCEDGVLSFDDYFNQFKPAKIAKKPYELYEIDFGGINIKLIRTRHVTTRKNSYKNSLISYGLIIDNRIFFTGDTQFQKEQLEWVLKNFPIETVLHDCDVLGYSEGVHASYTQLQTLPEEIKKKMYLCHYQKMIGLLDIKKDGFAGFVEQGVYYDF